MEGKDGVTVFKQRPTFMDLTKGTIMPPVSLKLDFIDHSTSLLYYTDV